MSTDPPGVLWWTKFRDERWPPPNGWKSNSLSKWLLLWMKCKVIKPFSSRNLVLIANLLGVKQSKLPSKINLHLLLFDSFSTFNQSWKSSFSNTATLATSKRFLQSLSIKHWLKTLVILLVTSSSILNLFITDSLLPSVPHKTIMNDSTLDLFTDHPDTEEPTIEELAAALEITVDYYLAEFVWWLSTRSTLSLINQFMLFVMPNIKH